MKINIVQLRGILRDKNGAVVPIGDGHVASQTLTAAGASSAISAAAEVARICTDTAVTFDAFGAGSSALLCAGMEMWVPVVAGQTFTFVAA